MASLPYYLGTAIRWCCLSTRDEDFSQQQEIAPTLADDDISDRAAVTRGAAFLDRAAGSANEARSNRDTVGHEFFKRFGVLLTLVAATAASSHDHKRNRDERTSASTAS